MSQSSAAQAESDFSSLYDITGRTVVITGGTGVLGAGITRLLAARGAQVGVLCRNADRGKQLLKDLGEFASRVELFAADVLDRDSLQKSCTEVLARFAKVDCLVNAAGGNQPRATTSRDLSFFDLPADALKSVFDLNLLGTILPSQVFGKVMAAQGHGVILNVSSMNAFRPLTRIPAYSAAKAAVSNFTQWLAVHMAQEYSPNIRVNAIAPGFFLTNQNRFLLTDQESGELTERGKSIVAHTPMKRFGQPEDLFGTVLWLLSPASSFVTGTVVPIDGGFAAYSGV